MAYIIIDLEWNQAYSGKRVVEDEKGKKLYGEIIQIGAVKLDDSMKAGDEFKINIRPKFYRIIHHKVKQLTGITQKALNCGKSFKVAIEEFRSWCGDDCIFLTWGPDDMRILRQNLEMYKLDTSWIETWFNVQVIYNIQTGGDGNQKALITAMEHFGINAVRPMHDALNDAYYTALIVEKLDLNTGIARIIEDAQNRAANEEKEPLSYEIYRGYETRHEAFADSDVVQVKCPECKRICKDTRKFTYERRGRYITISRCKKHGSFIVCLKFSKKRDGKYCVTKGIYEAGNDAESLYGECLKKAELRKRRVGDSSKDGILRTKSPRR